MSADTRVRFLADIAGQLPAERIVEVHCFAPMRQGGVESGIAVVALTRDENDDRFTVYTARYLHTRKGPDRGKWQVSVTEEADAPLVTVETVVRGVQRRAGDLEDPERLDGDIVRDLVASLAPAAAPAAPGRGTSGP
jgi:hypothetical protein